MRTLTATTSSIVVALCFAGNAFAKEWRGITPLHSTRENVERLLGRPSLSSHRALYYSLPHEIAVIHFETSSCEDGCGLGWNVPSGTVTTIGVIPKRKTLKAKLILNADLVAQDTGGGFVYYTNKREGLSVETYRESVTLIIYSPTEKETSFECPLTPECIVDFFPIFDEYGQLPFKDEKARLDNYLISMMERLSRGVYLVYGPNRTVRNKMMIRAERGKNYLIRRRGLEEQRLLIVDGGYGSRPRTELRLYSIGGTASNVYLFPASDPTGSH